MEFRSARPGEEGAIFALYRAVAGKDLCVWDDEYPGMGDIVHDMETDNLFVLEENGSIAGAISIVPENELEEWEFWTEREDAYEFARVVTSPACRGRGLAGVMVGHIEDVVRARGGRCIHILAAVGNIPAVKTYSRMGYGTVGRCFAFGHDYYAMEKQLTQQEGEN